MNILLVDDDYRIIKSVKLITEDTDYNLDIAHNGKEAVDKTFRNRNRYDICLMDGRMPVMDGIEATRIIRQEIESPYMPIIGTTANSFFHDSCMQAGMDAILGKPFEREALYRKIIELTVKRVKIQKRNDTIKIIKELPMSKSDFEELRELEKQGLTKFTLEDMEKEYQPHENIQQKLFYEFTYKGKKVTHFLDFNKEDPGRIQLPESFHRVNKVHMSPEKFAEYSMQEKEKMSQHTKFYEYPEGQEPDEKS